MGAGSGRWERAEVERDSSVETSEPTTPAAESSAVSEPRPQPASWRADLTAVATESYNWLLRPRVRLSLTGVLLLLIGGVFISNSVWTLPLVIVGALMVVTAWIGHRLEGRFVIEWGDTGAELGFRATVKAAQPTLHASPVTAAGQQRSTLASHRGAKAEPATLDVIEGEAHTVEIDVAELKALIAAAEAQAPGNATADPQHEVRIRRVAADAPAAR
jgi:hypothetical protein